MAPRQGSCLGFLLAGWVNRPRAEVVNRGVRHRLVGEVHLHKEQKDLFDKTAAAQALTASRNLLSARVRLHRIVLLGGELA